MKNMYLWGTFIYHIQKYGLEKTMYLAAFMHNQLNMTLFKSDNVYNGI